MCKAPLAGIGSDLLRSLPHSCLLATVPVNVGPMLAAVLMVVGFRPSGMGMRMGVEMGVLMAMRQCQAMTVLVGMDMLVGMPAFHRSLLCSHNLAAVHRMLPTSSWGF